MKVKSYFILLFILILIVTCKKKDLSPTEFCDVWSEGQIFAFSGLDGETKWSEPFTCTLLGDRLGIQIEHVENRQLWFGIVLDGEKRDRLPGHGRTQFASQESKIITSDVIDTKLFIEGIDTRLRMVFADRSTILGQLEVVNNSASPRQVVTECWLQGYSPNVIRENAVVQSTKDKTSSLVFSDTLSFEGVHPTRAFITRNLTPTDTILVDFSYSVFFKPNEKPSLERIEFEHLYQDKLASYVTLQVPNKRTTPEIRKTYIKAYSILRSNTQSPDGDIQFRWTMVDRIHHRYLSPYHSAFHAMGIKFHDIKWAENIIKAALKSQQPDGLIPRMKSPIDHSLSTQLPVLAWAVWDVFEMSQSEDLLEYCYPRLEKYLEWNFINRDRNENGLLEWIPNDEFGMNNSQRFKNGHDFDAIDFNCFAANEMEYLARIAELLGKSDKVQAWREKKGQMTHLINNLLWDDEHRIYCDRYFTGELSTVSAVLNYLPLFANVAATEQANILVKFLQDTLKCFEPQSKSNIGNSNFASARKLSRKSFPIHYNYFLVQGLRNYGYNRRAHKFTQHTIDEIIKWYIKDGIIYEFFDPTRQILPSELESNKHKVVKEYGCSAAVFIRMINELENY